MKQLICGLAICLAFSPILFAQPSFSLKLGSNTFRDDYYNRYNGYNRLSNLNVVPLFGLCIVQDIKHRTSFALDVLYLYKTTNGETGFPIETGLPFATLQPYWIIRNKSHWETLLGGSISYLLEKNDAWSEGYLWDLTGNYARNIVSSVDHLRRIDIDLFLGAQYHTKICDLYASYHHSITPFHLYSEFDNASMGYGYFREIQVGANIRMPSLKMRKNHRPKRPADKLKKIGCPS